MSPQQTYSWEHRYDPAKDLPPGTQPGPLAGAWYTELRVYRSASLNRLAMGLPVRVEAPTAKCTVYISGAEVVAAPADGQIAFRLYHTGASAPGLRVLVEMSPGMKTCRRVPREQELTKASVTDLGSFFPLGENGATYVLDQPRFMITSGQRFALRVTILTEEGLRSRSLLRTDARGVEAVQPGSEEPGLHAGVSSATRSVSAVSDLNAAIYPLPPPTTPLPSHREVYRHHRALYCPDRAARPLTAQQLARRQAADREDEVRYARQLEALNEQMRAMKSARDEDWLRMKCEMITAAKRAG